MLPPLRSQHTASFPALLREMGASVLVSTYQAGKLVVLREKDGVLNTHFSGFSRPMGLAERNGRLAIGTALEIWEYHDLPAVARRLEPAGSHDACFLPRASHVTGDVLIHEMAWAGDELVFVNTRFSCLCIRDWQYSFRPVWRPSFITAYTPDDRCHLNGMGLKDGRVQFVTALGKTDTAGGWRVNKRNGGLLIDVPSGEIIATGLSMPHSPRWYDGRLWVLDSGTGSLGTVDLNTGKYSPIVELPGFTRGLDFWGPFAFIGLSQVRESAIFSGIPLVERLEKRSCGVWVVDLRNGQLVGWVEFEEALQEIFAVQVLPGKRFPDVINDKTELIRNSYVLPDESLADVPADLRGFAPDSQNLP
ncbi:MAG: TIGR03032 family protein [Gemmataceae bacterium]